MKDRIQVTAVCNRSREKAERAAGLLGLPESGIHQDWETMIREKKDLDAVLIALPIPMNYPVSRACIDAGLAVFCEKPAGMNTEEAEKTLSLNRPEGPLFLTAENFHYHSLYNRAAALVREGKIGRLHSISWNVLQYMQTDNKYNKTPWRADNKYPGGYVMDGGVHFVHALQMLAGPVRTVYARTGSVEPGLGTMDSAFSLLTHENGVISSLNMGWRAASEEEALKVFGTEGSIIIREDSLILLNGAGEKTVIETEMEDSFYAEWSDFYTAWQTGTPPALKQEEAVRDVRVIEAILRSGESGQPVSR